MDPTPHTSLGLWSGRLPGVADPHSDLLLARGFLPYRPPRGTCEVWGRIAYLWYATAKALGFEALSIRCPDSLFVGHIQGMGMDIKGLASLPRRLQRTSASLTWCSLTLAAYLLGRTRSSTGTRGQQLTCFTALAAMTVSFTAALSLQRCRRSRPRPLLAGRRGL